MEPAITELDRHITEAEARLEKLRLLRAMLAEDPALADDLRRLLFTPSATGRRPDDSGDTPHLDKVIAFFESRNNGWHTVRQITKETGLSRGSINYLFYGSKHKAIFESESKGPKRTLWRRKVETTVVGAHQPLSKPPVEGRLPIMND